MAGLLKNIVSCHNVESDFPYFWCPFHTRFYPVNESLNTLDVIKNVDSFCHNCDGVYGNLYSFKKNLSGSKGWCHELLFLFIVQCLKITLINFQRLKCLRTRNHQKT